MRLVGAGLLWMMAAVAVEAKAFEWGTNLSGLSDYGTELPFVDLMHSSRVWFTKNADLSGPWDTEQAGKLTSRADGYPTHTPQTLPGVAAPQIAATIWADASAWPDGVYTVLFDGKGQVSLGLSVGDVKAAANRITFTLKRPAEGVPQVLLTLDRSDREDPVRNLRVLMPGTEATYASQPFNPAWLARLKAFSSVRFMDWGQTNNWGQPDPWTWSDASLFSWKDRSTLDRYTWTDRGVPYEMMIRLMNEQGFDGWVCVPHRASPEYLASMARLFHDTVDPKRRLTIEYSNETWNWMFGQAQWLKTYGHPSPAALANRKTDPRSFEYDPQVDWPERTTGNVQDALDAWTAAYGKDIGRLRRVVGIQTGWPDVARRVAANLRPGSFDALAATFYFGLSDESDAALDDLGSRATVNDIVRLARADRDRYERGWLTEIKALADKLGTRLVFYEGGQHLTPHPFGEEPSYAAALLAVQRSPEMGRLYTDWLRTLQRFGRAGEPLVLMNFSFIAPLSARYGSWGLLESLDQDTSRVPAPKWQAVIESLSW